jgi:hypothetical protein
LSIQELQSDQVIQLKRLISTYCNSRALNSGLGWFHFIRRFYSKYQIDLDTMLMIYKKKVDTNISLFEVMAKEQLFEKAIYLLQQMIVGRA